jgi:hypothetical protein
MPSRTAIQIPLCVRVHVSRWIASPRGRLVFVSRRAVTAVAFGLAVNAPSIAQAQRTVADSVSIRTIGSGVPTVVVVRAANVSFSVTAHAKAEVSAILYAPRNRSSNANHAGLLRATAAGDTALIELARALDAPYHLALSVPSRAALRVVGDNGGEVRIEGVRGSTEITHSNGGVTVLDAAGYVLVATSNGNIRVRLGDVERGLPMSFITSNGDIELTMPADVRVTLVIDDSVPLQSDFPLVSSDADGAREPGRGRSRLRRLAVNGGGPTIRLFTNNGIVRFRRL